MVDSVAASTPTNTKASIVNSLGAGSGVDTAALITQLVDAQFATKNARLTAQNDTLTAQISDIGKLKSGITSFSTGLESLIKGGSLATAPSSSDSSILAVTALPGVKLAGLSAQIEVRQLAAAQSAAAAPVADETAQIGGGTLTLTFGTASADNGALTSFNAGSGTPVAITIDPAHSSLDDIAAAINGAKAGLTASIVSDADGARLVLKGKSGADQAFTLTTTEDPDAPGLSALDIAPGATGTTIGTAAADAIVAVDGIALRRTTNSISDLVPGVKLDLTRAALGTQVTLSSVAPTENIRQAVSDFVSAFNELIGLVQSETDPATGSLHSDPAAKTLQRSLGALTLTPLVTSAAPGAPKTLAEIGVATNRDGTLSVNADQLQAALTNYPDAVEALFAAGTGATGGGISAAFSAVSAQAIDKTVGLGASETRYTAAQSKIADDEVKVSTDTDTLRAQLTKQFAASDARVAAYKVTQDFLKQQVDAWNSQNN